MSLGVTVPYLIIRRKTLKSPNFPKTLHYERKATQKNPVFLKTAFQPTKNTVSPSSNFSSSSVCANKATKTNKTSPLIPQFAKFKVTKQLQNFMTEVKESEANDHDFDYTDFDDDSTSDFNTPN